MSFHICLRLLSTWIFYHYLSANAVVLIITWAILSMQHPFIHPYAYSVLILLFTAITTAVTILLLSLFYYCYCYKTVATDNLCRARLSPGVGELTNHLLRLTNILWLPLCRINKLGFTSREDCCDPLYLWVISCWSTERRIPLPLYNTTPRRCNTLLNCMSGWCLS